MKKISKILLGVVVVLGLTLSGAMRGDVFADSICDAGNGISDDLKEAAGCNTKATITTTATTIIDAVIAVIGIVTVAVMVYGGFMYVTSQGDANKVKRGQQILLYGAIGLLVCIMAFAIVRFVGGAFVNET